MLLACLFGKSWAQPNLDYKYEANGLTLYRDALLEHVYYYIPIGLKLATDNEGKPEFKFLLMRYTGTHANRDQGIKRFRSLLTMKIINEVPSLVALEGVKQDLIEQNDLQKVELKPVPIQNLQALLVYSTLDGSGTLDTSAQVYEKGFFETTSEQSKDKGIYWKERNFVLRLDDNTAQAFWEAFDKKQTILSVGYAFFSRIKSYHKYEPDFSGSPELVEEMEKRFSTETDDSLQEDSLVLRVIKAGAFDITVDTEKWPDLLKKVDINEQMPPEYAVLEAYCYDFNNELRKDLYKIKLDIEASGVNGKPVKQSYTFQNSQPDIYATTIFFPHAVRLDMPYKHRTVEIYHDGNVKKSPWQEKENWHEILDITFQPEEPSGDDN